MNTGKITLAGLLERMHDWEQLNLVARQKGLTIKQRKDIDGWMVGIVNGSDSAYHAKTYDDLSSYVRGY